jgi:multicomponent Na+:H+ antiporter subunit G
MTDVVTVGVVAVFGAAAVLFSLVAVVGFYRLPDVYTRTHAASKSETLGALAALTATAIAFGTVSEVVKIAVLALFVFVTAPTAAHAVVRAAADTGLDPWTRDATVTDGGTDADRDDAALADRTEGRR